jgi:hypothetical protein
MKLNLLFVFAALVNAATGLVVEAEVQVIVPTDTNAGGTQPVELGAAGNYVILTKSGISSVPGSDITGDVAVSPIAWTAMTGFSMVLDAPTNRTRTENHRHHRSSINVEYIRYISRIDYQQPAVHQLTPW